ncbi:MULTISPECIES: DUF2290 domain-containing protein [Burkholderia cepacia complex]|uniref:Uncharacterized protein n=1 Tax=Burkholderia orbicola (strain MC0-3) TaxID=406425 RepID=B1K1V4_BURO0|nr:MULTISPECIES: DUF2290 domain-containing protein [Burkholderia cepacia complex]ACA90954.1 conserved hypothetical protein [Burkholderia orbicola MC0-3]MBR8159507.1 DUF2290 domain-containing protein [Burkholderia cenocepacia]
MTPDDVVKQITAITVKLIELAFVDEQNFPSVKKFPEHVVEIGLGSEIDLSVSLKNISYKEIYQALDHSGAFNVRMVDGALIQMVYSFAAGQLMSHRLAYFPSPSLEAYGAAP